MNLITAKKMFEEIQLDLQYRCFVLADIHEHWMWNYLFEAALEGEL